MPYRKILSPRFLRTDLASSVRTSKFAIFLTVAANKKVTANKKVAASKKLLQRGTEAGISNLKPVNDAWNADLSPPSSTFKTAWCTIKILCM